ncbi:MAG: hypothetical protein RB292_01240 [Patescibacteria group bacterium]|nr:hypothetical protein [Patescibacteria group bacterium]
MSHQVQVLTVLLVSKFEPRCVCRYKDGLTFGQNIPCHCGMFVLEDDPSKLPRDLWEEPGKELVFEDKLNPNGGLEKTCLAIMCDTMMGYFKERGDFSPRDTDE